MDWRKLMFLVWAGLFVAGLCAAVVITAIKLGPLAALAQAAALLLSAAAFALVFKKCGVFG